MAIEFPLQTRLTAKDSASSVLGTFGKRVERLGKKMSRMGRQWSLAVTAPIAAVGVSFARTFVDFETSMNAVGAFTGAVGEEFKSLEDLARKLGKTTAHSAVEAADGMAFFAKAGFKTNEILAAMPGAAALASAGQLSLAQASDIASNVMAGFSIQAEDFTRVADLIAFTATSANTSVELMGESFRDAAPIAKILGVDLDTVAGLIGVLGDAGLQGAKGGNLLKMSLLELVKPLDEAKRAFAGLGIVSGDVLNEDGTLTDFVGLLEKLHDAQATPQDLVAIFGKRAITGIGPLMASLDTGGSDALRARIEQIGSESEGAAQDMADRMMFGLSGALRILGSAWSALSISVGKSGFASTLQSIAQKMAAALNWLEELEGPTLSWAAGIGAVVASVGPLLIGLAAASKAFAIMQVGLAVLMGPVGIVILAIGGLVFAGHWLYKNWDAVVAHLKVGWDLAKGMALDGVSWITGHLDVLIGAGYSLYKHWEKIAGFLGGIWGGIKSTFADGVSWITDKLDGVVGVLGKVGSFVGLGGDSVEVAAADFAPSRLPGSAAQAAAAGSGQGRGQDGRARIEIDVRSDGPGVRARMVEARDVELSLEQGLALGVS